MFKVFYSWQSDLPGNKTRSFIRECIDEAIDLAQESEAIEAERDEATLGVTGSPDIVAKLLSKIDECDLFVADLTLCYTYDGDKSGKDGKRSPNPNVMLELGYAVKTLSWDRVVCVCNTDFGDDFPFDIDHNRRTGYSLDGKNRNDEKYRVAKIIFSNIRDLRGQIPRVKGGTAVHAIGNYDLEQKKVTNVLVPLDLKCRESYVLHNEELIDASKKLAEEIIGIKIDPVSNTLIEEPKSDMTEQDPLKTYVRLSAESFIGAEIPVHFDVDADRRLIREWLGINVDDAFFDCGGLKRKVQLIGGAETLIGTDEEKLKYKKLTELSDQLTQLETRSLYLSAFNRLDYLPLAIQNISDVEDQSIRIVVHVVEGEIVNPSRDLICEELEDNQGFLCRDEDENSGVGIIDELFILPEDGNVHVEEQPFEYSPDLPKIPTLVNGRLQYPGKDEKDYENELQEYIAWSSNGNYYEFEVKSLRPNECKWLSYGMLIKPTEEGIKLTYQIHSSRSGGDLSGELEWRKQN